VHDGLLRNDFGLAFCACNLQMYGLDETDLVFIKELIDPPLDIDERKVSRIFSIPNVVA
jgi:hypothetical protein